MATPFRLKRSAVASKRPGLTDLQAGELALNTYDGKLYAERDTGGVGIGTTIAMINPWTEGYGGGSINYTGVVTATTYYGDQIIGTPTGGSFRAGAYTPVATEKTKDSVDELNYILGKLVPAQPDTISGVNLTVEVNYGGTYNGQAVLCAGFTPVNNASGSPAPTAGTVYLRNTDSTISTGTLTDYGPGDSGTLTGYINNVGVGTTTFNVSFGLYAEGNNANTSDKIIITNNTDAADSARNVGITSLFYEVFDVEFSNAPSPDGYNKAKITHGSNTTAEAFWYEDPSTVGVPDMTFSAVTPPSVGVTSTSSGVPHYTNSTSNKFTYVITVENATGDMYYWTHNRLLWAENATTGFTRPDQYKLFTDFAGGTHPPARNFGVGTGVTCLAEHTPNNTHATITSNHFHRWDCWTPYGNDQNERVSYSTNINIMGSADYTNNVDEDGIECTVGSLTAGSAKRVNAGSTGDNPTPVYTAWTSVGTPAVYEAIVRGGDLRHDVTNYSTGYLPVGPDLSSGRSGSQYFQMEFIQSAISEFQISYTGDLAGCWVCMPQNSTWTTSLSGKNGWADMFQAYRGAGVPTTAEPGCSSGGLMDSNGGTFTCVFGTESTSNDTGNRVLIRFKLTTGQSISDISFSDT